MASNEKRDQASEDQHLIGDVPVDPTELQAGNEELRRAHANLDLLSKEVAEFYQLAPMGYLTLDDSSRIIEANTQAARLFQVDTRRLIGSHIIRFVPIESRAAFEAHRSHAGQNDVSTSDMALGRAEGPTFFAHIITHTMFVDGAVERYRMIIEDITERKKAEEALVQSEQRFRSTLDSMLEGCQIIGHDWRYIYINEAAERHNRRPNEELLGNRYMNMWPGIGSTDVFAALDRCMEDRVPQDMENEFVFPDGTKGWFELKVSPVPEGIFILSMDITDRKRAEEALIESEKLSSALNQINAHINSTLDYRVIMDRVQEEGVRALGAESSLINLREGDFWVARSVLNFPSSILNQLKTDEESPTSMLVMKERKSVAIEDAYNDIRVDRQAMRSFGVRSLLVIPISLKDRIIGIIAFYYHSKQVQFNDAQIDFANKLAKSLSLAIENAQLFESVSRSEARYHRLFENLHEAVSVFKYVLDENGEVIDREYLDVNREAERLLRRPREELIGRTFAQVFGQKDAVQYIPTIRKAKETGELVVVESYFEPLDVYLISWAVPLTEDTVLTSSLDITAIKRAQHRAEEERSRLQAVLDTAPVGIFISDTAGKPLLLNGAFKTIWGPGSPTPGSINEHRQFRAWHADTGEEFQREELPSVKALKGEANTSVVDIQRFDGRRGTVIISAVPMRNVDGEITGAVSVAQDITDIKSAEEELRRSNAELKQFAYVASHDLQEPLRMVTAYLNLLEKRYGGQLDGKAKQYMDFAIEGGRRARELIRDLLEFSRIDSQAKSFQPVDMEEVLERALGGLRLQILDEHAIVTHDALPTVLADDMQMVQILQNLINNAIKFHQDESPRVHLSCEDKGQEWQFSVRDNGIGIDPQYRDNIFVLFQRLHGRDRYEGTGIGLAICKKIVERHGGRIWFESQPGKGTTFYFTLPKWSPGAP